MINWFTSGNPKMAPCAKAYLEANKTKPNRKANMNDLRLIVLDSETSGFSPERDRLLSIATTEIIKGKIDLSKGRQWTVFQPNAGPTSATAIHGILPSETRLGIPEKEVLEHLLPLLGNSIIIGHHVRFDAAMLNTALRRHFNISIQNRVIDTALLARQELTAFHRSGYANQRPPSLEDVCEHLGLPMIARHTAEGDAFVTAQVFLLLCGRIRRRTKGAVPLKKLPLTRPL
jgi:DNA polymerase-3 subunit epsilon